MLSHAEIQVNLNNSLKELGLSEHEMNLYTLSLSRGPATINDLAKFLSVSRPNLYKVIAGLEKQSLAHFSDKKGYKKTFIVEPPTVITEMLRKKREAIAIFEQQAISIMPSLLEIYQQGDLPAIVQLKHGEKEFLDVFNQILVEAKDTMEFFGSAHDIIKFISWAHEREWIKERVKKNLLIRCLIFPSDDAEILKNTDKSELRETKILNQCTPFSSSFHLFANKVILWQPKAPMGILITDETLVAMFRSIFYGYWNNIVEEGIDIKKT